MQLTFTPWTVLTLAEKAYISCQKHESHCITFFPLVAVCCCVPFNTSLKSNLRPVQATQTTTENKCTTSHTKHDCPFKWDTLITNKGRSSFPSANNC